MNVSRKRLSVSETTAVTNKILVSGRNTKYHITDINLHLSGAGAVTIRGGGNNDNEIIYKSQLAAAGSLDVFAVDLFAGVGDIRLTVSTTITVTGTIFYWDEQAGN